VGRRECGYRENARLDAYRLRQAQSWVAGGGGNPVGLIRFGGHPKKEVEMDFDQVLKSGQLRVPNLASV